MQVNDLTFTCTDGIWTLADDPDYALTQSSVRKMAGTILEMQTAWTITAPDADSAYGLDAPDVTATLSFTDGTSLTVRFGTASASDDSLCYLASSDAPTLVYEVNADHKSAFAVTKESLHDDTATAETAADTDVVASTPSAARTTTPTVCRTKYSRAKAFPLGEGGRRRMRRHCHENPLTGYGRVAPFCCLALALQICYYNSNCRGEHCSPANLPLALVPRVNACYPSLVGADSISACAVRHTTHPHPKGGDPL